MSLTWHLASLTKPFASTIVLQLVEERRLELDDPVSRFDIALDRSAVCAAASVGR